MTERTESPVHLQMCAAVLGELVRRLTLNPFACAYVKSNAELAHLKRAAELATSGVSLTVIHCVSSKCNWVGFQESGTLREPCVRCGLQTRDVDRGAS